MNPRAVINTETWLQGPLKTQFYTFTCFPRDDPPKAVVVYIHAFADHVGRHTHFFPLISQHGIAVFAFDQRGSGLTALDTKKRSEGSAYGKTSWRDQMRDIGWAIEHVKTAFKDIPIFLSGHALVSCHEHLELKGLYSPLLGRCGSPWVCHEKCKVASIQCRISPGGHCHVPYYSTNSASLEASEVGGF